MLIGPSLRRAMRGLKALPGLLLEAAKEFMRDRCHALGAALAFYALLSIAPLVLLMFTLAAAFLGLETATETVAPVVREWLGMRRAELIDFMLARLGQGGYSLRAVEVLGLALGASGFFGQLKDSLETIWGTRREELGLKKLKKTLLEVILALVGALLILLSLAAGVFFRAMITRPEAERLIPGGAVLWQGAEVLALLVFLSLVFAVMFKVLPEVRLTWRDVLPGAAFTALVYTLGRAVTAHYLARLGADTASGLAASLLVFLLWIYYTSQVFLFGAEFTRLYSERHGSLQRPEERGVTG